MMANLKYNLELLLLLELLFWDTTVLNEECDIHTQICLKLVNIIRIELFYGLFRARKICVKLDVTGMKIRC